MRGEGGRGAGKVPTFAVREWIQVADRRRFSSETREWLPYVISQCRNGDKWGSQVSSGNGCHMSFSRAEMDPGGDQEMVIK